MFTNEYINSGLEKADLEPRELLALSTKVMNKLSEIDGEGQYSKKYRELMSMDFEGWMNLREKQNEAFETLRDHPFAPNSDELLLKLELAKDNLESWEDKLIEEKGNEAFRQMHKTRKMLMRYANAVQGLIRRR